MTTTTAFLAQVKKRKSWDVYHVDDGNAFKPGYKFRVFGTKPNGVSRVCVIDLKGKETVYKPNPGTLVIESTNANILTIHFLFEGGTKRNPKTRAFFLRFFFFCDDPTLFRYQIKDVPTEYLDWNACDQNKFCCNPIDYLYSSDTHITDRNTGKVQLKSSSKLKASFKMAKATSSGDRGSGGPRH